MTQLVAVSLDDQTLQSVQTSASAWGVEFIHESSASALDHLRQPLANVAVLILGDVPDPIRTTQRAHMAAPHVPVVILGAQAKCQAIQERLRFSAFIGPNVRCLPREASDVVLRTIEAFIGGAQQRRTYRTTVDALNVKLAQAKAPARSAEVILGRLLDIAPVGIVITDDDGHVRALNPRAEHFLPGPESLFIGRPIWDAFCADDRDRARALFRRFNGDPAAQPTEVFSHETRPLQIEVTGARLAEPTENTGYLVLLQDATERLDLIAQLRAASRRKDEFLAMLAHELRNPIAPIRTAMELLRLREVPGIERERDIIERQVHNLVGLIDDLLDISRITRGTLELRPQDLEVSTFVADAVEMSAPLLERNGHTLTLSVPVSGLQVHGDRTRLAQVLANLLTNAAKYTPPRGEVIVSAGAEGSEVVISVRDNGQGIDPDLLPQIFAPFVQQAQSLDRAKGGLGLGLAIVRSLVELHRGSVSVTSELGRGSVFTIRLPAHAAGVADTSAAPATASDGAAAPETVADDGHGSAPSRVLVVDDNEDAALMLAEMLRSVGCIVEVAYDGPEALGLARTFKPDLALVDIGLPVMDGYEVAERMLAMEEAAPSVLVAVTGYGSESDRERSRQAGFGHHLVKPVAFADLRGILASVRDSKAGHRLSR